jgi:NADH-quinone oxidoreductase subunit N
MLAAALPPLVTPRGVDILGILPEVILGGGFVLLLMLDLVTGPAHRGRLAVVSLLAVAASFGATVWGWFDTATPHTVYFGAFAYDRFGLFINAIILVSTALVLMISPQYLNRRGLHYGEYYSLILAAATGMMLLAGASSIMVIFLAIELLSIALYILSGFSHLEPRSQEAALKYLLLGGFASGFLLFGMALIYGETGHTQLAQIASALQSAGNTVDPLLMAGIALLFVGLAFKISAAPFHAWTPDVYQGAPTSVTMFMSVTTKVAAFAALIRVFTYTLGQPAVYDRWKIMVYFVAIASMVIGNVAALRQTSLKRVLGYSGVAQAGYILIGVVVLDPLGTIAALYYLAAYAVTNIGAFAVITIMAGRGEDMDSYDSLRGLAFRRPYVAAAMALSLLSLGGFPPTAGFFAKFFVFSAAIHAHEVPLALWGIGTSAVSVFYYLRVALLMYTRPPADEPAYNWSRTSIAGGGVLLLTTAGTLVLGIFVSLVWNVAVAAQHGILPSSLL